MKKEYNIKSLLKIIVLNMIMLMVLGMRCKLAEPIMFVIMYAGVLAMFVVYRKPLSTYIKDLNKLGSYHCFMSVCITFIILTADWMGREGVINIITVLYTAGLLLCGNMIMHYFKS